MNELAVRISPELKDEFVQWLKEKSPKYIVAEELGSKTEKIHYHCYFQTEVGLQSVKKFLQAQCKTKGLMTGRGQENAYYGALKECNDSFIEYVMKEQPTLVKCVYEGFTENQLNDFYLIGREKYADRSKDKPPQVLTPEKKRKLDMDKFCDDLYSSLVIRKVDGLTINDAYKTICHELLKFKWARINDNVAFPIIQSVLYRVFPHRVEEEFEERLSRKFGGLFSFH